MVYNPHRRLRTTDKVNHKFYGPFQIVAKILLVNYRVKACFGKEQENSSSCLAHQKFQMRQSNSLEQEITLCENEVFAIDNLSGAELEERRREATWKGQKGEGSEKMPTSMREKEND